MKKVCKNFYSLFAGVLITSAMLSSCVWTPVNDLSKIRNKTSIKKISEFNVPFVFYDNVDQDFESRSLPSRRQIGGVFIAVDLENPTMTDYVFLKCEDICYSSPLTTLKTSDGQNEYLFMNESYGYTSLRDSETSVKQTLSKEVKISSNWGDTSMYTPRYGLNHNYDLQKNVLLEIIDSDDKSRKNLDFQCTNYLNMKFIADNEGNYWTIEEQLSDDHFIASPAYINSAEGKLYHTPIKLDTQTDPVEKDNFQVLFVNEDYIFINNNPYISEIDNPKLLVFNKHDLTEAPVEIPVTQETSKIAAMFKTGGEYVIAAFETQEKLELHTIDVSAKTITSKNKTVKVPYFEKWILHGNKLYIIENTNITFVYHSIDLTDSSTKATRTSISVEDLF